MQQNFETSESASGRVRTEPGNSGNQNDGSVNDSEFTSNGSVASFGNTLPGPSHSGPVSERGSMFKVWGIRAGVLKEKALWTIHSVINHHSFSSNSNTSAQVKVMSPDSPIAKKFSCGANKMSYLAAFGIVTFFTEELYNSLSHAQYYGVRLTAKQGPSS